MGKLIHVENLKSKISWPCPFKDAKKLIFFIFFSYKLPADRHITSVLTIKFFAKIL